VSIRQRYDRSTIDTGVSRIDIANGYDAFSLDNTRETLSDNPGEDSLQLDAGFVRWNYEGDGMSHNCKQVQLALTLATATTRTGALSALRHFGSTAPLTPMTETLNAKQ
jgi:hypothetical protein